MGDVKITGVGIEASIGNGVTEFSSSLKSGRCGVRRTFREGYPELAVSIGAEIEGFDFLERLKSLVGIPDEILGRARKLGRRAPFTIQVSILSALEAWAGAALFEVPPNPERTALLIAGQNTTLRHHYELSSDYRKTPEYLTPRYGLEFLDTNQVGVLSEVLDIRGEGCVVGGASATGNVGAIKAAQTIEGGYADVCLVVGVVADLSPMEIQGFYSMGAMGGRIYADRPEEACRPFDRQHEGFIYGQAGASLVFESRESASCRGRSSLAEIRGYALTLDGNSSSNPSIDGEILTMRRALARSGYATGDIDYINTHGSSSPLGDRIEAEAILNVFGGSDHYMMNATKGLTGHCLYSAGIVEIIATVQQMKEGFLHPNVNLLDPEVQGLPYCSGSSVERPVRVALSNSYGFGGINSSLVLSRCS